MKYITILASIFLCSASMAKDLTLFLRDPIPRQAVDAEAFQRYTGKSFHVAVDVRGLAESGLNIEHPPVLTIPLPNGKVARLVNSRFKPVAGFVFDERGELIVDPDIGDAGLSYFWYGVHPDAELSLYVHEGKVAAALRHGNDAWTINESGGGPVLRAVNTRAYPGDGVAIPDDKVVLPTKQHDTQSHGAPGILPNKSAKTVDNIDVLVVYTQKALTASGDFEGMPPVINLAIEQLNTAFANSGNVNCAGSKRSE